MASFHSGRWVFIQIPPSGTRFTSFASSRSRSFSARVTRTSSPSAPWTNLPSRTEPGDAGFDERLVVLVEGDRLERVDQDLVVLGDPVGDVGVGEDRGVEHVVQPTGMEPGRSLQQPEQVDDLVVAPVADVGERVLRLRDLPVDPRREIRYGL